MINTAIDITKFGMVSGIGSSVITGAGGSATSMQSLSSWLPVTTSLTMGGKTLKLFKQLKI